MAINLLAKVLPHHPVEMTYINGAYVVMIHDSNRAEALINVAYEMLK